MVESMEHRKGSIGLFLLVFFVAVGFGIAGLAIVPPGEIHSSVLILIAQILVLAGGVYGLSLNFNIKEGKMKAGKDEEKKESE